MSRLNIKGIDSLISSCLYVISTISNFTFWTTSNNCSSYIFEKSIVCCVCCSIKRIHTNFNSTLFTIVKCFKVRISCFFNLFLNTFTKKSKSCKKITSRRPWFVCFRILSLNIPDKLNIVGYIFLIEIELFINNRVNISSFTFVILLS